MTTITTILLLALAMQTLAEPYQSIIDPDSTGENSESYRENLEGLTYLASFGDFNTTLTFTNNSNTLLWVPWYDSSTACVLDGTGEGGNLKDYSGGSTACDTVNNLDGDTQSLVTDELSEVMVGLSTGNASHEEHFYASYNTVQLMGGLGSWGQIPYWAWCRDGNSIYDMSGDDSASDATWRIIIALFQAGNNSNFAVGNRTLYNELAKNLTRDSLIYEFKDVGTDGMNTPAGNISRVPFGGRDAANAGFGGTSPRWWSGYGQDGTQAFMMACAYTGNETYCEVAEDIVGSMMAMVNYTGGVSADSFNVSPKNGIWENKSGKLVFSEATGEGYHWDPTNEQWDDSDAPRYWGICHSLRAWNITKGNISGVYFGNLSDYCQSWANNAPTLWTSTSTCLQINWDRSCKDSLGGGVYENGLGVGLFTWHNTSLLKNKIDTTLDNFDYTRGNYDSTSCGNALMYRGVRATKGLQYAIGMDGGVYNLAGVSGGVGGSCQEDNEGVIYTILCFFGFCEFQGTSCEDTRTREEQAPSFVCTASGCS